MCVLQVCSRVTEVTPTLQAVPSGSPHILPGSRDPAADERETRSSVYVYIHT